MFKNLKELRNVIFEEEPQSVTASPVSVPQPSSRLGPESLGSLGTGGDLTAIPSDVSHDDVEQVYHGLLRVANVNSCQSYGIVRGIQDDLEDAIADKTLRMKAALAMAAKQGATRDKVMQEITSLKVLLDHERDVIDVRLREELSKAVNGGTQEVAARENEIRQKQEELDKLRASIIDSKEKITRKRNAFETAYKRRREELGQLEVEFSQYK